MEFNSEEDNSLDRLLCSSQENTLNNSKVEVVEDIDYEDECENFENPENHEAPHNVQDLQKPKNPEKPQNPENSQNIQNFENIDNSENQETPEPPENEVIKVSLKRTEINDNDIQNDYINDYVTPEPKELMSIGSFSSTKRKCEILFRDVADLLINFCKKISN